jgi:hypothetical protein
MAWRVRIAGPLWLQDTDVYEAFIRILKRLIGHTNQHNKERDALLAMVSLFNLLVCCCSRTLS